MQVRQEMETSGQNKRFCEKWSLRTFVMLTAKGNDNYGRFIITRDDKGCSSMCKDE